MSSANRSQQQQLYSANDEGEVNKLLEEKEKDLELAAKIGQSLLEQNRELQNRNDFLEESLNASNDTVVQLRHELQMRINLLHVYADYDDENEACGSRERRSNVEPLQRRMKALEKENLALRHEASTLRKQSAGIEEREQLRMTECAKQLDAANEKIARLQSLIAEKNEECAAQTAEVERLLREVAVRGAREKALAAENIDLHEQLNEALAMHEELSAEVVELQERYTEVMSMLHDAEEELRAFRQNQKSHRTASADSLYDSLASELEASDSGFYSTLSSARSESGSDSGGAKSDAKRLHVELERIRFKEPNEPPLIESPPSPAPPPPLPSSEQQQQQQQQEEEIAQSSSFGVAESQTSSSCDGDGGGDGGDGGGGGTRSVAVSTLDDHHQASASSTSGNAIDTDRQRKISHCSDDVVDVPSALLAELVKTSRTIERLRLPPSAIKHHHTVVVDRVDPHLGSPLPPKPSTQTTELPLPQIAAAVATNVNSSYQSTPVLVHSTPNESRKSQDMERRLSDTSIEEIWTPRDGMRRAAGRRNSCSSVNGGTLSKAASSDSLAGYEGPKMGEPGRPGTRDLDFSIRRLNIRKQVEREYARFRRERGLSPLCIPFFPPPIPMNKRAYAMLQSQSLQQYSNDFLQRFLNGDHSRFLQPWNSVSNVGLLAAIRDSVSQGILIRSTILRNPPTTPPSTPLTHRRHGNGMIVHPQQCSSKATVSNLVDALGLCVSSDRPVQNPGGIAPKKQSERRDNPLATVITKFNEPKTGIFTRTAPLS